MPRCLVSLFLVMAMACGGGEGMVGEPDAGEPDGGADASTTPPPPVELVPCPDGWVESMDDSGVIYCEPWPMGAFERCGPGEAHMPGTAGCAPVGRACGGDFASEVPSDRPVLHVSVGATGGDGSISLPLGTITEALTLSVPGQIVAVGEGTYEENLEPAGDVTLWGACAEATRIPGVDSGRQPNVITLTQPGVELRNVTIGGNPMVLGLYLTDAGAIHLEGVAIEDVGGAALVGFGASLTANGLVARNSGFEGILFFGAGLSELRRVVLEGVPLEVGSKMDGDPVRLLDSAMVGPGMFWVDTFSEVEIARTVFEEHDVVALVATEAQLRVTQSVIRRASGDTSAQSGFGLAVMQSTVDVDRTYFQSNRAAGVLVGGISQLQMRDVLIADTSSNAEDQGGMGISAGESATVDVERFVLRNQQLCGIQVAGAAEMNLRDGAVGFTPIGACVQVPGYDIERLQDRVRYHDNEVNLQATDLPVPQLDLSSRGS